MFGTGQALGGHIRRHRASMINEQSVFSSMVYTSPDNDRRQSSKRNMHLDLNLTPMENDLVYIFAKNLATHIDLKIEN